MKLATDGDTFSRLRSLIRNLTYPVGQMIFDPPAMPDCNALLLTGKHAHRVVTKKHIGLSRI